MKKIREELGFSQRQMARLLEISQASVYRYETDTILSMSVADKLLKLAGPDYGFDDVFNPRMLKSPKEDKLRARKAQRQ